MKLPTKIFIFSVMSTAFFFGALQVYALDYKPLEPITQIGQKVGTVVDFPGYVKGVFNIAIIIAAILAIIMITWGGIKYMTTEAVTSKGDAKKNINNAVFGLIMALGAYLILFTLNSDLVNFNLHLPDSEVSSLSQTNNGGPFYLVYSPSSIYNLTAVDTSLSPQKRVLIKTYTKGDECNADQSHLAAKYKNPLCDYTAGGSLVGLSFTDRQVCINQMNTLTSQNGYIAVNGKPSYNYVACGTVPPPEEIVVTPSTGTGGASDLPGEQAYPISVSVSGPGRITGDKNIDCGSRCTAGIITAVTINSSDSIGVTAIADPGAMFTGWSGDCSGTEADCSLTVTMMTPPSGLRATASFAYGKFSINDDVKTTDYLNVRATPTISGILIGTEKSGIAGKIFGGPVFADGFYWWNVNFESAYGWAPLSGWVIEDYLQKLN